jgi:hypothetical protein
MKRRQFITLAGVATGMVLIPPALYFISPEEKKYAAQLIENELYYLKLAPGSVVNYVDDYFHATGNDMVSALKWKTLYYLKYNWEKSDKIKDLIKYFLLSSDFFINKTDEHKTVHYLGLYSPYTSPLANPYSFALYPPADIKDP